MKFDNTRQKIRDKQLTINHLCILSLLIYSHYLPTNIKLKKPFLQIVRKASLRLHSYKLKSWNS